LKKDFHYKLIISRTFIGCCCYFKAITVKIDPEIHLKEAY
jgi:hypothetical protein